MKKQFSGILGLALAIVMMVGLFTFTVFADEINSDVPGEDVTASEEIVDGDEVAEIAEIGEDSDNQGDFDTYDGIQTIYESAMDFVSITGDIITQEEAATIDSSVSVSADTAINYVKSLQGQSIDVDGSYGAQCVDLIMKYYDYLIGYHVSGNACDYTWNALPSGWTRVQGGTPQKGDILVYVGGYGHVGIYESDYSHYHQNVSGSYVERISSFRYNQFTAASYWGYIRPDFKNATGILDVNWVINGNQITVGQSACTVDVYLNGALVANDVDDYFGTGIAPGTSYVVTDIKPKSGYKYMGTSTSYSGTISSGATTIWIYVDTAILGSEMTKGYDRVLPDGDYVIASAKQWSYYLDIEGIEVPAPNQSNVGLFFLQDWTLTPQIFPICDVWTLTYNNGFYTIKQKNSNVALDVAGGSKEEGANVQVYESNGTVAQQWAISRNGPDGYRIQSRCSGFSLDFSTFAKGTNVRQWTNNSGDGQSWIIVNYLCSKPLDVEKVYRDVKYGDWFASSVAFAFDRGIMMGMGNTGNFAPYDSLCREQLATILYRLEGYSDIPYIKKFPDVPNGQWFTSPIIWAYNNGIITGYQNGRFGVGDSITREQFATMLYRYAVYKQLDTSLKTSLNKFNDKNLVSGWAYEAMQWAVGNGIISGKDNGTRIDPYGNAARCECAAMIQRFMVRYGL